MIRGPKTEKLYRSVLPEDGTRLVVNYHLGADAGDQSNAVDVRIGDLGSTLKKGARLRRTHVDTFFDGPSPLVVLNHIMAEHR
jgi:hypothetical protein